MQDVNIKKGYRLRMAGAPSSELVSLPDPALLAALPERIPHIRPKLSVNRGDRVEIGSPLFVDKRNPRVQFLSPAGGVVERIDYGPRRVIRAIVIKRTADDEPGRSFPTLPADSIGTMERGRLVDHILKGGLWWIFRQLPFRDIPAPDTRPPAIILNLTAKEPFLPDPRIYLQDRDELVAYGIKVLQRLAPDQVTVMGDSDLAGSETGARWMTHRVAGCYPADDPGTLLYHVKTKPEQNRAWFVTGQDLILLAQLLSRGQYPVGRIVTVAGSNAKTARHFSTRMGAPLSSLVNPRDVADGTRFLVGGILRGYASDLNGFMGQYETALNLIPDGDQAEFLSLFKPGYDKPSYSRAFLSALNTGSLVYDCNRKGGERACIACMHCADVCPVDILPHFAYKAVVADEIEESLEMGLLDCVECGLCSYVCPSKIELSQNFMAAKAAYAKEVGGGEG